MIIYIDSDKHKFETKAEMISHVLESVEMMLTDTEDLKDCTVAIRRCESVSIKTEDLCLLLDRFSDMAKEYLE